MNSTFKCMVPASKKIIGRYDMESIMNMTFYIGKKNNIQICFGDTIEMENPIKPQEITDETYPNEGSTFWGKHGLWISMFARHMEDSLLVEFEEELEKE